MLAGRRARLEVGQGHAPAAAALAAGAGHFLEAHLAEDAPGDAVGDGMGVSFSMALMALMALMAQYHRARMTRAGAAGGRRALGGAAHGQFAGRREVARAGERLANGDAGNLRQHVVQAFEMLDIERGGGSAGSSGARMAGSGRP